MTFDQAPPASAAAAGLEARASMIDNPGNCQARQYRMLIIVLCVMPPIVALRFVSRHIRRMHFGWDDLTLVLGFLLVYVSAGLEIMGLHRGLGVHTVDLTQKQVVKSIQALLIFDMIYIPCLSLLKLSVLLMYRRIFPVKVVEVGSIILGIMVLAWAISSYFIAVLQCNPPAKLWNQSMPGFCLDPFAVLIGPGVPNFITDILILALPMKSILRLRVSHGRKVLIIFTFLTGFFVVAVSIYRLVVQSKNNPQDMTFTIVDSMSWCVVELGAGVVSCCLPTLMPVINLALSRFEWGRRLLQYDQAHNAYNYGNTEDSKKAHVGSAGDYDHPLTTSSFGKDSPTCHASTWQILDEEERNAQSRDAKKPPNTQEPWDIQMDNLEGIRVSRKVEIRNHY